MTESSTTPPWYFAEGANAGEEHLDPDQVATYDEKLPFDPSDEVAILRELGLSKSDTVVDFGTGTGEFPLAVAPFCGRVVGVDVSPTMLDVAREKLAESSVENGEDVEFVESGLLRYDHDGDLAAAVFSKNVLHHLPDFWKVEALKRIHDTLEPGGIFRLRDLVYSFDPAASHEEIASWLDGMRDTLFTESELHRHFSEEHSTYDFLMERMLDEAGFEVLEATYRRGFYAAYTCRKRESRR